MNRTTTKMTLSTARKTRTEKRNDDRSDRSRAKEVLTAFRQAPEFLIKAALRAGAECRACADLV